MRGGLRYLPVPRRGRRRLAVVGLGLVAAMSLVWQQQATLATYTDAEYAGASFDAARLTAITPTLNASASKVRADWSGDEPTRKWAVPQYRLDSSATGSGAGTNRYTGPALDYTYDDGGAQPGPRPLTFTAVAAGTTHACGIAQGEVYCWGTSGSGALGGASSPARAPQRVTGLPGTATMVDAGTDFSCALVGGDVYCWGANGSGQLGNNSTTASPVPQPQRVQGLAGTVTSLSAGATHACAVAGGTAYCWGSDANGRLGDGASIANRTTAASLATSGALSGRTVASISAGAAHTCAVADGRAFCWGSNGSSRLGSGLAGDQAVPVAVDVSGHLMGRAVLAVSAGDTHTCAIADDRVYCWGANDASQLGNGSTTPAPAPTPATSGWGDSVDPVAVTSGAAHSCVLTETGRVYCWGSMFAASPTAVTGLGTGNTATAISIGRNFACAAVAGAPAACVGENLAYQLGNGTTTSVMTFTNVSLTGPACPEGSVRMSTGTCSLVEDTTYFFKLGYSIGTWTAPDSEWTSTRTTTRAGRTPTGAAVSNGIKLEWEAAPERGQAYAEYTIERRRTSDAPAQMVAVTGDLTWTDRGGLAPTREFTRVSAGGAHTCGIVGQTLYCWGSNDLGQLGVGDTTQRTTPTRVGGALDGLAVTAVSAGQGHTCAIAGGDLYCWGNNLNGQLGIGSTGGNRQVPQRILTNVGSVSAGASHTCAVSAGVVSCWGLNGSGQLGLGNATTRNTPQTVLNTRYCDFWCQIFGGSGTPVFTNGSASEVAAGDAHTCVVSDGSAYCWGAGGNGRLGNGGTAASDEAVKVSDGAMGNSGLTAVTAGGLHTCALRAGAAYCWGGDGSGQLGSTATTTRATTPVAVAAPATAGVTDISAGTSGTCAVVATRAYCWGSDSAGQLGNGSAGASATPTAVMATGALENTNVTAVAAGDTHACAVAGGAAYCSGSGANGRLGTRTTTDSTVPVGVVADARCAGGAVALGNGTCSLATGSSYQYRVTFTLDGRIQRTGNWETVTAG